MKTAITLLIVLGVVSALGTFIPQGQPQTFYFHAYGHLTGSLITLLSLNQLYQTWWFQLITGILSLSILICGYQRLRHVNNLKSAGSLLLHIAVVVTVIGSVWSLGYAKSFYLEIPVGEKVALAEHGLRDGRLGLKDFKVDYYPDFQPRQYASQLSLKGYKGKNYEERIAVNHPLKANSLKIYQSSWGWVMNLSQLTPDSAKTIQIKDKNTYRLQAGMDVRAVFIPDYAEESGNIESQSPLPNRPHVWLTLLQDGKIIDMTVLAPGEEAQLGLFTLRFDNYSYFSGLQVKEDPGVYLVFAGFILLILGILARYWQLFFPPKEV
ncbi:cytochrome c biogenesis protein ResB [Syntrophomonas zehnderi]|nr:cytochrome c biogenesis protein ResB [Syntrophomonas zehnderi]